MILDLDTIARIEQLIVNYEIAHVACRDTPAIACYHLTAADYFVDQARVHAVDLRPTDCRVLNASMDSFGTAHFRMGWRPDKVGTVGVLIGAPDVVVELDDIEEPVQVGDFCRHVDGWDDVAHAWALGLCEYACYEKL